MEDKVSLILLNYNGIELLKSYLYSVVNQSYKNKEIIVVDNGSVDESCSYIENNCPQIKIIKNNKNYGISEGYNIGARNAAGEYLFFLANDMRLEGNATEVMVKRIIGDKQCGIVTCKTRGMDTLILDSFGCSIDVFGFPNSIGAGEIDRGQYNHISYVPFSFGSCMLISKKLFFEVGGYNEYYHSQYDDFDLSWRVRLSGYEIGICSDAVIGHKISTTMKKIFKQSYIRYLSERNMYIMLIKNLGFRRLIWVIPCCVIMTIAEIFIRLWRREWITLWSLLKVFAYLIKNIPDLIKKRIAVRKYAKVNDSAIYRYFYRGSYKIKNWLKGNA
jgi:hypothetical protein